MDGWIDGLKKILSVEYLIFLGGSVSFWINAFLTGMKQELTRMKKGAWSLDEVEYKTDVKSEIINTDNWKLERNQTSSIEGAFFSRFVHWGCIQE